MGNKKRMSKILSVLCAFVLVISAMKLPTLVALGSDSNTPQEYERLTLANFGIKDGQSVAVTGLTSKTDKFNAGDGNLDGTEVKGIFNFSATYDTFSGVNGGGKIYVGGDSKGLVIEAQPASKQLKIMYHDGSEHEMTSGQVRITNDEITNAGFSLFDSDIILSLKFDAEDMTKTETDVQVTITLSDKNNPTKSYSETCTMKQKTAYMTRYMSIMVHRTYNITMKYLEDDYQTITFADFGFEQGQKITKTTVTKNAGEGSLDGVRIEGYVNIPKPSSGASKIMFGQTIGMEFYSNGEVWIRTQETTDGGYANANPYGVASWNNYWGKDTKLTVEFSYSNMVAGKGTLQMTVKANGNLIATKTTPYTITESRATRSMWIQAATDTEPITVKNELIINYETLDFSDFDVLDEVAIGDWTTTEIGETYTAGEGTLHEIDVIGKYKFDSSTFDNGWGTTNYARVYFGGETQNFYMEYRPVQQYLQFGYNAGSGNQSLGETYRITKENAEAAGLTFFDTEIILSVKFVCDNPEAANTDVSIIITLSDPSDPEKKVVREMTLSNHPMSGMQRVVRVAQNYSGRLTYAPVVPVVTGPVTFETLGLDDFGVEYGTEISGWYAEQGTTYQGGEGSLHATEIVGNYALKPYEFDNGWGTTNYARVYFGGETDNFFVEFSPVHKNIRFGYKTGGTAVKFADTFNITMAEMEEAGLSFFDVLTTMSAKFECRKPTAEKSDVKVTVTFCDTKDATKSVTRELQLTKFPMAALTRTLTVAQAYDCRLKYEPLEVVVPEYTGKIEQVDIGYFGVEDTTSISGWTTTEKQEVFAELKGTLHATEVIGNFKFDATKFDNNYGTTNYTRVYYGGAGTGFYVEYRPVQEYLRFGYIDANGTAVNINQAYNITKADLEAAGLKLTGEQLTMKVKFICATPDDETSDLKVVVTICDPDEESKSVMREMTISDFPMSGMNRVLTIAQNYNGIMQFGPKSFVVTGNKVNFKRFGFTENWAKELELR